MKFLTLLTAFLFTNTLSAADKTVPPPGIKIPDADRVELASGAAALARDIEALRANPKLAALLPDVELFHKAVHDALAHDEFYDAKQIGFAKTLLKEGSARAKALRAGQTPWLAASGVRGYRSRIDGSVQPYGLVIPETWKAGGKTPHQLWFWLHGRSENLTELSFVASQLKASANFAAPDAFSVNLYGRFCCASKFAGEVDLFEAMQNVRANYSIDPQRMVVTGFSMGGASTWHIAAHHAGWWAAASPGAGFAETAIYQKVFAEGNEPPPWYEQVLWRWYDATDYAANLVNTHLIAYSGEIDPQRQSADLMEKAMAAEGLKMERLIGPKTAHKYEAATKAELTKRLVALAAKGREPVPAKVHLTTYTLRYNRMDWLEVDALEHHWLRADVDAQIAGDRMEMKTRNVEALRFVAPSTAGALANVKQIVIDGATLPPVWTKAGAQFHKENGVWKTGPLAVPGAHKTRGLTGPIDDAFMDSFIFVRPTGKPLNNKVGGWAQSELDRAIVEWRRVFRGDARVKNDTAITAADIANSNLVLWGDPSSNAMLVKVLPKLPIRWDTRTLTIGKDNYSATDHAPILIYPNPLNPSRYVVLNSSFTFREGAAISNSQQTPKLPDWSIIDLRTSPTSHLPGAVENAGFFGEQWEVTDNTALKNSTRQK